MKLGIVGAGQLGTGLTKQLVKRGHQVVLSFSRDAEQLQTTAKSLGVVAGTAADAAQFAEVIVLAAPYTAMAEAIEQMGEIPPGKVVWDCTNPLKPDMSGLLIGTTTSAGEELARRTPWATVVKAIPPFADVLHSGRTDIGGNAPAVFVCGDDTDACKKVAVLVRDIGGKPVEAGPLVYARFVEPANMLLVALAYGSGFGARISFTLNQES